VIAAESLSAAAFLAISATVVVPVAVIVADEVAVSKAALN